jgi:DNA transformation protein
MHKTSRRDGAALEDLPNVGKAIADDLRIIGIRSPRALRGRDPYALYERLNHATGVRHDPCVLDTFIAAVRFVDGGPARPWWSYTSERKRRLADRDGTSHDSTPGMSQ